MRRPTLNPLSLSRKVLPLIGGGALCGLYLFSTLHIDPAEASTPHYWPEGTVTEKGFPVAKAEEVLSHGYGLITARTLDPLTAADFSLLALRGLAETDPYIQVTRDGSHVMLHLDGTLLRTFKAPEPHDNQAWARLTIAAILALRPHSKGVAHASEENLYRELFSGALKKLDKFSRYASPDFARRNRENRSGFGGLGFRYRRAGTGLSVVEILPETAAEHAALEKGDIVTHIDGLPVKNMSRGDIPSQLRGLIGSSVSLTVLRQGSSTPTTLKMKRALVVPSTVSSRFEDGVLTVAIKSFNQRTAAMVEKTIRAHQSDATVKALLLDLRGNPGGLLDQGIAVADLFLESGAIVSTWGRHPQSLQSYHATRGDVLNGKPIAVLIDGGSASAAEIVAAAIQDHGRGIAIGSATYGKGTVQTVLRLPNNGEITLTWSRFHAPSGYTLEGLGVLPALCTVSEGHRTEEAILTALRKGNLPTASTFDSWRSVIPEDESMRQSLRETCPATDQTAHNLSQQIAKTLLKQPQTFRHALSLIAPASAAR